MKTLTRKNNYKNNSIVSLRANTDKAKQSFLLIIIVMFIFLPQKAQAYEYAAPAWMDNEHIICVKYVPTTKKRLIPFLGDLSDARYILTKQEIQLVSMDINGNNEKVIKSIVIDYPGMSPKWQEEIFQGMNRIDQIAYCPQRKLIVFSTRGFTERVYMVNSDGTGAKKIAEVGGGMYFSPNGKYMQYTSNYKVWLYDLGTGEQKVLVANAVSGPWSPDGKKIIFSKKINNYWEAFIYDLQTNQETLYEEFNKKSIGMINAWSPDGTMLATPSGGIYSLQAEYLKEISVATPNGAKWSFDGKHLVGDPVEKADITIVDSDGKNPRILR